MPDCSGSVTPHDSTTFLNCTRIVDYCPSSDSRLSFSHSCFIWHRSLSEDAAAGDNRPCPFGRAIFDDVDRVDHVGHDAGVVRNDAELLADRKTDRAVRDEAAMLFGELVDPDVVAIKYVPVTGETKQVRGQDLAAGVDDRSIFAWNRDDGREHCEGAVIP